MATFIKVEGDEQVLKALPYLLKQVSQALSPWDLKVIEVVNEHEEEYEDTPVDVVLNEDEENDEYEEEINCFLEDSSFPKEEEEEKKESKLIKKFLNSNTYSTEDTSRTNSVQEVKTLTLPHGIALEVNMEKAMSERQVQSFCNFLLKQEVNDFKVFHQYEISEDKKGSNPSRDDKQFVVTIRNEIKTSSRPPQRNPKTKVRKLILS